MDLVWEDDSCFLFWMIESEGGRLFEPHKKVPVYVQNDLIVSYLIEPLMTPHEF